MKRHAFRTASPWTGRASTMPARASAGPAGNRFRMFPVTTIACPDRRPVFGLRTVGLPANLWSAALILCLLVAFPLHAEFKDRVQFVIDTYAHPKSQLHRATPTSRRNSAFMKMPAPCSRRLEELLAAGPTGDMFWMFPITAIAYLDQGQLTDSARQALRRSFRTTTCPTAATRRITGCCTTPACTCGADVAGPGVATNGSRVSPPRRTCAKPRAGLNPGSNLPPRAGRASTTARTTWGSTFFPCPTWPSGPRIRQ